MPDWAWVVIVGAVLALVGIVWRTHERHDQERDESSKKRDESLWDQVGRDSQSGMRKTAHDAYNMGLANKGLIERLEDRVKEIASRVFNGHK